jgi:large-conductance mechanosensitive channel
MNISNGVNNFRKNLKEFLTSQNIIGTIASVTIAVSAGNMIRSFVNDIIFPTFYLLVKKKHTKKFKPISYEQASLFGKEFITFLLVLVCTFYFIIKFMMVLFDIKPNMNSATAATSKATNLSNTISGDIASGNANISHTSH